jgi:hypothetical protein
MRNEIAQRRPLDQERPHIAIDPNQYGGEWGDNWNGIGCSVLVCRFPRLLLNVGHFHLRTWLQEPPGGDIYETLDGICYFEVVRISETHFGAGVRKFVPIMTSMLG